MSCDCSILGSGPQRRCRTFLNVCLDSSFWCFCYLSFYKKKVAYVLYKPFQNQRLVCIVEPPLKTEGMFMFWRKKLTLTLGCFLLQKREDGSDMWVQDPERGQFYLSQFDDLPDLNLTNEDVIAEFKVTSVSRCWFCIWYVGTRHRFAVPAPASVS